MLSPGHRPIGPRTADAGTNPLASGHFVFEDQNNNVTGNNLDSGQTQAVAHFGRARVNPFAVGHTANANRNPRAGAILRRAVRPATTNNPSLAVLTPSHVAHASGHNQPAGDPLLVATEPADHQRGRATDNPRPIAHEDRIQLAEGNLKNETREVVCG